MELSKLNDDELIHLYGNWLEELKKRKIIRTNNVVGDLGEYLAKEYYHNHPGLPNLQLTMNSSANIDAVSNKGQRYSIKTTTNNTTGSFFGFNPPDSKEQPTLFEYVIIVKLNKDYTVNKIIEITYHQFLKFKKWHKTMSAWYLSITKELIKEAKIIYEEQKNS